MSRALNGFRVQKRHFQLLTSLSGKTMSSHFYSIHLHKSRKNAPYNHAKSIGICSQCYGKYHFTSSGNMQKKSTNELIYLLLIERNSRALFGISSSWLWLEKSTMNHGASWNLLFFKLYKISFDLTKSSTWRVCFIFFFQINPKKAFRMLRSA